MEAFIGQTKDRTSLVAQGFQRVHLALRTLVVLGWSIPLSVLASQEVHGQTFRQLYRPSPAPDIQRPRFSPDEAKLAFNVCHPCRVAICSIATQNSVLLGHAEHGSTFDPTFDPRSDRIAFVVSRKLPNGNWDYQIAVSHIDGSGYRVLTSSDTQKRSPKFAFDGSKILFEGKGRCLRDQTKYCGADAYAFDLGTKQERRLTDLQTLQLAPVSLLPSNDKIVLTAYGSAHSRELGYAARVEVEKVYGDKQRVFVVALSDPGKLVAIAAGTPTATSPMALSTGEIAFLSRVNEYDGVKVGFVYDVFIYGPAGTRRLTKVSRYIRSFGISNSAQSVAFVTESRDKPARVGLSVWNAADGQTRDLQCDKSVEERTLVP